MSSKKTNAPKKSAAQPRRWSLGVFQSKESGEPVVMYCRIDGTIAPYLSKKVRAQKASKRGVFVDMTYAEASAKLLKQAGVKEKAAGKKAKAAKRTPASEEPQRRAA